MDTGTTTSPGVKLIIASNKGNLEEVKKLLSKFKSTDVVNYQNNHGSTPLMEASEQGHLEIVELLIADKANVNLADSWGYTALMHAANKNQVAIAQALLNAGAKRDSVDCVGFTALMIAQREKHTAVINLFSTPDAALSNSALSLPALDCLVPSAPTVVFSSTLQPPALPSSASLSPQSKDNLVRYAGHTPKRPSIS